MLLDDGARKIKSQFRSQHLVFNAQENGIAEKSIHLVKKMAQTIHKSAGFPPHFWLLSMNLACHILMFSTPRRFGGSVTCYERMFGRKPVRCLSPSCSRLLGLLLCISD